MSTAVTGLPGSGTAPTAWNQLDQLLTCAICLDKYRNPKLLPCQHTYCMEPCLEGLIDYIRRQIKCPECRAEHRIPYQGIQGFPTNVTLMRFLELHFEVSGETPDPTPTIKERCGVCSEKAYLGHCGHCEKKVCPDCKEAHLDILKREISRLNNQVRRGLHRLQDALSQSEKSVHQLQQNCVNVTQEIDEFYGRLQKVLKEREETLKHEVANFLQTELHNLTQLKDNLEIEVGNIQSNCDLVEKHVSEHSEWEDVELVDYKETFLKTLEFVRNFDADQAEFNGKLKFSQGGDMDLHQVLPQHGELVITGQLFQPANTPITQSSTNLMRSKSDHRLATQFHRQEESKNFLSVGQRYGGHTSDGEGRDGRAPSPLSRRKNEGDSYGRRISQGNQDDSDRFGGSRYGRSWQKEEETTGGYRSRYNRDDLREGSDPDSLPARSVRFGRQEQQDVPPRQKVFDTEEMIKGPLSGIVRLLDSPIVVRKIQINEQKVKQKAEEKLHPPPPTPAPAPAPAPVRRPQRQVSEDDEIAKIKAQNKAGTSSTSTSTPTTTTATTTTTDSSRPLARRVAALQDSGRGSLSRSNSQEESTDTTSRRRRDDATDTTTSTRGSISTSSPTSSRPVSRQPSNDQFKTPPTTPTDKSSPSSRLFSRTPSTTSTYKSAPAPTPITEPKPSSSSSESDSDRHTGSRTIGTGRSVDDAKVSKEESSSEESESEEEEESSEETTTTTRTPNTPTTPTRPTVPSTVSKDDDDSRLNRSRN